MQQLVNLIRLNLKTAVLSSIRPSFTISTAIFTAAGAVRLPLRVCSM
jgi:hypothetical protein